MVNMDDIIKKAEEAYKLAYDFDTTYSECSQATMYALQTVYGLKDESILKGIVALAGGGLHRCDGSCGVYQASIFFLGMHVARGAEDLDKDKDDPSAFKKMEDLFGLGDRIYKKFIDNYGSIKCGDIQRKLMGRAYYLRDEDEMKKFKEDGGYSIEVGPGIVANGAKWTVEILEEYLNNKR